MNRITLLLILTVCFFSEINGQIQIDSNLVAFYPFCENVQDLSANSNHGINYGGTFIEDVNGNPNSACSFDGIDDYIEIPNSMELQNIENELSLSLWLYPREYFCNSSGCWIHIITKSNNPDINSRQYSIVYNSDGVIYFANTEIGTYNFSLNQWYHVVLIYDNQEIKFYVNGGLEITINVDNLIVVNDLPIQIAKDIPGTVEYTNSVIDDIYIHNRILNLDEISYLSETAFNCNTTTVDEAENNQINYKIYPNPTNGLLYIESDFKIQSITILDLNGRRISNKYDTQIGEKKTDISELPIGTYLCKVITQDKVFVEKITKIEGIR